MKNPGIWILMCCMLSVLSGCPVKPGQEGGEQKSIRIGLLNGPSKISMAMMMQEIRQLKNGTRINYVVKNSPDLIIAEMAKGSVDFVILPTTSAALLYNRGIRYRLLGIPVWGTLALAGTAQGIEDFGDLKGKTVYMMGRGMTPDIVFRYLLSRKDLVPGEDVFLDYTFPAPNELANAIGAGIADIGIISEPHTSIIVAGNREIRRIINLAEIWEQATGGEIPFAQSAFVVREGFGERYPEVVGMVQRHYRESINFMVSRPDEAAEMLRNFEEFTDLEPARQCLRHIQLDYREAWSIRDKIGRYLEVFLRMDDRTIGNKLPDEAFYYPQ